MNHDGHIDGIEMDELTDEEANKAWMKAQEGFADTVPMPLQLTPKVEEEPPKDILEDFWGSTEHAPLI
jgi:hypothetical protein